VGGEMILDRNPYIYFDSNNTGARWFFFAKILTLKEEKSPALKYYLGKKVM
jgi:hypothetical protein